MICNTSTVLWFSSNYYSSCSKPCCITQAPSLAALLGLGCIGNDKGVHAQHHIRHEQWHARVPALHLALANHGKRSCTPGLRKCTLTCMGSTPAISGAGVGSGKAGEPT